MAAKDHGTQLFSIVDEAHVILRKRGVFRQVKLYLREEKPYAGTGSTFIRLLQNGVTSDPDTKWVDLVNAPNSINLARP